MQADLIRRNNITLTGTDGPVLVYAHGFGCNQVEDLIEVCSAMDIHNDAVFIGHSVSSSIGVLASIAKPQLFSKMILMEQNYLGWANYLAPVVSSQDAQGAVTVELSNSVCSTDPTTASAFARATFFADNRDDLRNVACPSLILQHRQDALAPLSVGDYMHAQMPASSLKVLEVSGHCAHMSHPDLVVQAMTQFIGAH